MSEEIKRKMNKIETDIGGGSDPSSAAPFVSVMVLNYNYGELLSRALEACAAQTFRDFEVVMINNGAIDNTEEIWQAFCEKHPEIRKTYVHVEKNQGPKHGWNEGFRRTRGEYVMYNDSDDWMDPDCLENLAKRAKETGADRVSGQFRYVLPDGKTIKETCAGGKYSIIDIMMHCVLFRRSVIVENDLLFPEKTEIESYDYWMTYSFSAVEKNRGVIINKTLYNYMINPKSITHEYSHDHKNYGYITEMNKSLIITHAAEVLKQVKDKKLCDEVEYLTIKGVYSAIVYTMQHCTKAEANQCHDHLCSLLNEKLPGWDKNPLLWPFGNGYERFISVCTYALVCMDKLHMLWLIRLSGKLSALFKFRR